MGTSNVLNVLWTGGLDSSYLIVKLCLQGEGTIQPYYIIDEERRSVGKELQAIYDITSWIRNSGKSKRQLLDVIVVNRRSVKEYHDITDAWKRLNEKYKLGSQYDWLARYAKQESLKLMLGVLMEPRGKVVQTLEGKQMAIKKYGEIDVFSTEGVLGLNKDVELVYDNFMFPCMITGMTKKQEWEDLSLSGFEDVAKMTWFCHSPVFGMTCGQCSPCKDALHEDMAFRVSKIGYVLGYIRKLYWRNKGHVKGAKKRLSRLFR